MASLGLDLLHVCLALLLGCVFLYLNHRPLWHTDIWGHLKFGQWICQHRELPAASPFLPETDKAAPLAHFSWLAQVGFYQAFHLGELLAGEGHSEAGGVEALRTLHALLIVLRMSVLYLAFLQVGQSRFVAMLGVVVVFLLGLPSIEVLRPQVFAEVFFALVLLALSQPRLSNGIGVALAMLISLWANLHGSFMIGLLVMGGANGGQFLQGCREAGRVNLRAVWRHEPFRRLFLCIMLSLLCAGLLNPAGFGIYPAVLSFSQHPAVAMMDEWQPVAWGTPWGMVFLISLLYVAVTLLAGMFLLPRPETKRMLLAGIPLGQVLLLLFFGWRTFGCQRFMLWWVFLSVWVSMSVWGPLWLRFAASPRWQRQLLSAYALAALAVVLVTTFMFSGTGYWLVQEQPRPAARAVHSATPWALAQQLRAPLSEAMPPLRQWLQAQGKERFTGRIFTTETMGEYLLWALPPEQAPLLCTHVHLFPAAHWHACLQVRAGAGDWEAVLERMQANMIVVEAELHPELRRQLRSPEHVKRWQVLVDESGGQRKGDPRSRWLIAVRKDVAFSR